MREKNYYWGFFLIIIAALMLGNFFNLFTIPGNMFSIVVTVMLIAFSLSNIPRLNFSGIIMPLIFAAVINKGLIREHFGFEGNFWWLIIGGFFLSGGLSALFKRPRYKSRTEYTYSSSDSFGYNSTNDDDDRVVDVEYTDHSETPDEENTANDNRRERANYDESQTDDSIQISASFTDRTRYVRSSNFTKGAIANSFGSLRVYFDQSTFNPNGAKLDVNCSFGQVVLYLPHNINVINNISSTLGGLDDDFNRSSQNAPTLTINGDVAFGNIKIVYI